MIVASEAAEASDGDPATVTCARSASSSARSRVRFQTVTSKPAAARLRAIGAPMIPIPRNAIRLGTSMSATPRGLDPQPLPRAQRTRSLGRQI